MPSPFPGMDPYLERPGRWGDVHTRLINVASDLLTEQLLPRYVVRIEERVYLEDDGYEPRGGIIPDARVLKNPLDAAARSPVPAVRPTAGTALVIEDKTLLDDEVHEPRLEVVDLSGGAVVAVIEVLSPSNKRRGSAAWNSYREKRTEVMHSGSHLVEIDLLRAGTRMVRSARLPAHDYLVHVSPAPRRPRGLLYPVRLDEPLPTVAIPLKPGEAEAQLPLQAALDTVYDRAGYRFQVDYRDDPPDPLDDARAAWADALLKEKGLR